MLYHGYTVSVQPNDPIYVGFWIYNVSTRDGLRSVGGVALTKWGAKRLAKRAARRMRSHW